GAQNRTRQIKVDAARASGDSGPDRARNTDADVLGPLDAVGGFGKGLGRVHLVELFVFALLQIDGGPIARSADLYHREAVGGGIRKSHHTVEKAGRRDGQADARLLRQIAGDRRRVTGGGFMAEADIAAPRGLGQTGQIGDRYAGDAIDSVEAVQLQGVHDEVE